MPKILIQPIRKSHTVGILEKSSEKVPDLLETYEAEQQAFSAAREGDAFGKVSFKSTEMWDNKQSDKCTLTDKKGGQKGRVTEVLTYSAKTFTILGILRKFTQLSSWLSGFKSNPLERLRLFFWYKNTQSLPTSLHTRLHNALKFLQHLTQLLTIVHNFSKTLTIL